MIIDRRKFLTTLGISTTMAGLGHLGACACELSGNSLDQLDAALNRPVLKKQAFTSPVIIEDVQLLHYNGSFICKVYAKDGAVGISICNNLRIHYLYPIFLKRVAPFFIGKDARDIEDLLRDVYVYKSNYKMQGYALGVPVACVELALLDLLANIKQVPLGKLFGDTYREKAGIYLATRFRNKSAEASIENAVALVEQHGYKAVKFKIGNRMGNNKEAIEGRSEKLIPLARKAFGDNIWLGVDANGAYDVNEAIRIGRILEANQYSFFEEPVPFDWYQETKQVADQLKIKIAGGEQEPSMRNFRWLASVNAHQVFRPDIFYFGGMIRSIKVARMAEVCGHTCVPHISGSGLGYLYALHFLTAIKNAGEFHPNSRDNDNPIPIECESSNLTVVNGEIKIPSGVGLGVTIDPSFINKHNVVTTI